MVDTRSDVIVVGAGFSGSLTATLLRRSGFNVTLVDRYEQYPNEFRAEQLVGGQIGALRKLGVLDALVAGVPLVPRAIAGRRGQIIGGVETPHYGVAYSSMVARLRAQIPSCVKFIVGKVESVGVHGAERCVTLADGTTLTAPLVVLATGMNTSLPEKLGVKRTIVSAGHSLAIAFDMSIPALGPNLVGTYYGSTENRIDYVTVFPFEGRQRANMFMYASPTDREVNEFQADPARCLRALMPQLEAAMGDFTITGRPVKRLNDIWVSDPLLDGVVVIGDAFQTPCPSAGTGITRLVSDVDLLCNRYIPSWLRRGSVTSAQLLDFYRDPAKVQVDRQALHDAHYRRMVSTQTSLRWQVHRKRLAVVHALSRQMEKVSFMGREAVVR